MRALKSMLYFSLLLVFAFLSKEINAQQNISETKNSKQLSKKKIKEEWASIARHSAPEWFRDAKFGIYTHYKPTKGKIVVTQLAKIYPYLDRDIQSVQLLSTDEKNTWNRDKKGLHLSFPKNAMGKHAFSYKLTLKNKK